MPNVLITGGNGFLGSNIIPQLIGAGFNVTNLSLHPIQDESIKSLVFDAFRDDLSAMLANMDFDFVIHLAAFSSPQMATDPNKTTELNVNFTKQLLKLSMRFTSLKQFLFFSSATTYSDSAPRPLTENSPQQALPNDFYAHSKIEAEAVCKAYLNQGLPVKIFRLTNCFGLHQGWKEKPNLIPQIMKQAILDRKITILNGDYTRDFLYSKDLARIVLLCLEDERDFDILNIASGKLHRVGDIAEIIGNRLNVPVEDLKQQLNRSKTLTLDITKFNHLYPTFIFTPLKKSLDETLSYYLDKIHP